MTDSSQNSRLEAALDAREAELRAEAETAFDRANRNPTTANRKAYRAAEQALQKFLQERHEPETELTFKGLPQVLEYLEGENWKISKSKLYDDFGAGKIDASRDGSFRLTKVLEYARVHLQTADGKKGGEVVSVQEEKAREEVLRIRIDRQQRELRLDEARGELIRRSEVETELSKRAIFLVTDRKNVWRSNAMEIIRLVGGDPQKAPELIAYGVRMEDEIIGRYSRSVHFDEE